VLPGNISCASWFIAKHVEIPAGSKLYNLIAQGIGARILVGEILTDTFLALDGNRSPGLPSESTSLETLERRAKR
jgi:hypothetical protein